MFLGMVFAELANFHSSDRRRRDRFPSLVMGHLPRSVSLP